MVWATVPFADGSTRTIDISDLQQLGAMMHAMSRNVLALKDNHPKLFADTKWMFDHGDSVGWDNIEHSYHKTHERGHGREETRECWVLDALDILDEKEAWKDLHSLVRVRSARVIGEKRSLQDRFFISSLPCDASRLLKAVRAHWGIENGLHWTLDVAFREDDCRVRKGHAPENFALLRHIAVNAIKQEKTAKLGVKNKRLNAGWDDSYLDKILLGI